MKGPMLTALAASMMLAPSAGIAQSEQGEEKRAVFIEADFCAIVLAPTPWDGSFFLAFGEDYQAVHTSGGTTNIQCRAQASAFATAPTETVKTEAPCGYFDEDTGEMWEGTARVTVEPDGSAVSKCNLNSKDSIGFVEFPSGE